MTELSQLSVFYILLVYNSIFSGKFNSTVNNIEIKQRKKLLKSIAFAICGREIRATSIKKQQKRRLIIIGIANY